MTLSDQLGRWARLTPEAELLRFEGVSQTYARTDDRVSSLAAALAALGVRRGDRVAVLSSNRPEVWEAYFAGIRLGAVLVPVNFRFVPGEVAFVLADSGAKVLLVESALSETAAEALATVAGVEAVVEIADGDPREPFLAYERLIAGHEDVGTAPVAVEDSDAAFILYTSGTTGRPKGAVLTHRNLIVHAFSQVVQNGVSAAESVFASVVPLFHVAGLTGGLPPLLLGKCMAVMRSGGFDPAELVRWIERERINSLFLVPAMWARVVALPDIASHDLSSLRRVTWGAAPASTTLLRRLTETFPQAEVIAAFGQTECGTTFYLRGVDALRKIGSIGKPLLNTEVRIVDESMADVPGGEVGELVYRSPMVMKEYWGRPDATAEAFTGGWFHSGDLVRRDEEGFFFVVDRKKDMIISGGENIYCAEVEDALAAHPEVAEVAVIGVPDLRYGEAPLAVVVARDPAHPPTSAELAAWCRERLAGYKVPRSFSISGPLPRNAGGKVLKRTLRDEHSVGALVAEPVL